MDRPTEARERLEGLLGQGRQAINEGRDAVQGLRSSTVVTNDLACALTTLVEKLTAEKDEQNPVAFHVGIEGQSRDLYPIVRGEVYRIASEAVRNAFHHACASRIEVELDYSANQLRVLVRDDGCGIEANVLESGRDGHWGLSGMRERAEKIGAKLNLLSRIEDGRGTEVEISIPGHNAFVSPSSGSATSWVSGLYRRCLRRPFHLYEV